MADRRTHSSVDIYNKTDKRYINEMFFKGEIGINASGTTFSAGSVLENAPVDILSGSFRVDESTVNGYRSKEITCVTSGNLYIRTRLPRKDGWIRYIDGTEVSTLLSANNTIAMTAGEKLIYACNDPKYSLRNNGLDFFGEWETTKLAQSWIIRQAVGYNYQYDWGDSFKNNVVGIGVVQTTTHNFQNAGSYKIRFFCDNVNLQYFDCNGNQLTNSIPNLDNNVDLRYFSCSTNQLTNSIPNLDNNVNLAIFSCSTNQLTGSIPNLDNNVNLVIFYCFDNQLTGSIPNLDNNVNLTTFYCHVNQLTNSIPNLDNNVNLAIFYCHTNQITDYTPSTLSTTIIDFQAQNNLLSSDAVNQILLDFTVNAGSRPAAGTRRIWLDGTGNGAADPTIKANLIAALPAGWDVRTN
jgi:hypothetical protein